MGIFIHENARLGGVTDTVKTYYDIVLYRHNTQHAYYEPVNHTFGMLLVFHEGRFEVESLSPSLTIFLCQK